MRYRSYRGSISTSRIFLREGGFCARATSRSSSELRSVRDNGARCSRSLSSASARHRNKSSIIGYNRVSATIIDIPRAYSENVPEEYIRRQTLSTSERFFTQELKELENTLLTAKDRIAELEFREFEKIRLAAAAEVTRIQAVADAIAELDCLCSLGEVAVKNGYTMRRWTCPRLSIIIGGAPGVELTCLRHALSPRAFSTAPTTVSPS